MPAPAIAIRGASLKPGSEDSTGTSGPMAFLSFCRPRGLLRRVSTLRLGALTIWAGAAAVDPNQPREGRLCPGHNALIVMILGAWLSVCLSHRLWGRDSGPDSLTGAPI